MGLRIYYRFCQALLLAAGLFPVQALAYDATWYKTDFWSGEYPHGFTLNEDVTTQIRADHDPKAQKDIACTMEKGATYHPWNGDRVKSSKLEFLSFVPIETYVIKAPVTFTLHDEQTKSDVTVSFKQGDEWTYLTYYGEGAFRMKFQDKVYAAEQDLFEASKEKDGKKTDTQVDEWLKLTCANGATGWLLLGDVLGQPGYDSPKYVEYGVAVDKVIAATDPGPAPVTLKAAMWPVGKWPEGIVHDGKSLWYAEAARRRIVQINASNGRVIKRVKVGRYPSAMVANSKGSVFALAIYSDLVWVQPRKGRGKRLTKLPDYSVDMVGDDETLWAITQLTKQNNVEQVVRIDQNSGKSTKSEPLSGQGFNLTQGFGKVWVSHGDYMSVLDAKTLGDVRELPLDGFMYHLAANSHGVFTSAGKDKGRETMISVVKLDGETGREAARRDLPVPVFSLAVDDDHVIAASGEGKIWVLSPEDLSIQRIIELNVGKFEPFTILPLKDTLYITTYKGRGVNGSVVVVKDWRP